MSQAVHADQLICCDCKYREISRHNKMCPNCPGITMAYDSAILRLEQAKVSIEIPPRPPGQEEVPGQLFLFGGAA